jgi:hypothetical protein
MDAFKSGQNKFVAQFIQSRKNVANYIQRTAADEGYLVAKMVRMEKEQLIVLLPPVDHSAADAEDQKNHSRGGHKGHCEVKSEAKQRAEKGLCNREGSVLPRSEG